MNKTSKKIDRLTRIEIFIEKLFLGKHYTAR